jgi:hypothetical protein
LFLAPRAYPDPKEMKTMFRKALIVAVMTASLVGLGASSALALDCVNVSRPAPAQPAQPIVDSPGEITIWVVQGDWWYVTFGGGSFADAVWDKVPPGTAVSVLGLSPEERHWWDFRPVR